ncbi:MAG: NTP transferase domain-containing protein [Cyanobacteria bacterium J06621_11]
MLSRNLSLSVIVLAGGYSRRMGKDKALLTYHGQSLLGHTVQVAQQLSNDVLLVTPWPERYQSILHDSVRYVTEPVHTSSDQQSDTSISSHPPQKLSAGPLSGFSYGWQHTLSDWCLVLACDLPYLKADPLLQWWQWISVNARNSWPNMSTHPMASLVLSCSSIQKPSHSRIRWQPLCGYYHRSCLSALNQQTTKQKKSFQNWLATLPIARYESVPRQMLFNCNTPTDWVQFVTAQQTESTHRPNLQPHI